MGKSSYFIGIDNGTQSTKALILDLDSGLVVGKATKAYGIIQGLPPGHKEQDPAVWIDALHWTITKAIDQARINPKDVKSIGISGQQHGFVPIDRKGDVIRPVKLWNDTSTIEECKILTETLGGKESVISLIGNTLPPGFTASKILWLKRNEPQNYEKLETILLPHDYLNFYLTGEKVMEYGDASGTALMDVRSRTWSKKVLEAIDPNLENMLPPLQGSDKPAGTIKKEVAELFKFREDLLISAGGGDNMMGAIGTGNTKEGIITASLGTSGTIYAYSDKPIIDPEGEIAAFCDSTNSWLPLLCTMNVTVSTELVRNLFQLSHVELTKIVSNTPAGSGGLILLPYFEGERTPNIPDGTGVFYGLNHRTFNPPHLIRAAMEGATLGMNYGLNRIRELGISPMEIRLTGGGSKNQVWRQIAASIFNTNVVCLEIDEGAAYGAALQAVWTYLNHSGEEISIQEITDTYVKIEEATRTKPKSSDAVHYRELQLLHDEISKDLRKSFQKHRQYLDRYMSS